MTRLKPKIVMTPVIFFIAAQERCVSKLLEQAEFTEEGSKSNASYEVASRQSQRGRGDCKHLFCWVLPFTPRPGANQKF
jgi:hypothetical protein